MQWWKKRTCSSVSPLTYLHNASTEMKKIKVFMILSRRGGRLDSWKVNDWVRQWQLKGKGFLSKIKLPHPSSCRSHIIGTGTNAALKLFWILYWFTIYIIWFVGLLSVRPSVPHSFSVSHFAVDHVLQWRDQFKYNGKKKKRKFSFSLISWR